jgi:hypothetical protein
MGRRRRKAVGRRRASFVVLFVVLGAASACQPSASTRSGDAPLPRAPSESAPAPAAAAQPERTQPEPRAGLVDRIHELTRDWSRGVTREGVEKSLEVALSASGSGFSGTSTRWPVVVTYAPASAPGGTSLQLALTDPTQVTLADIEARFGPPASQVKAKESLAEFNAAPGVRLLASMLGGLGPASAVARITLENSPPQNPALSREF